MLLLTCVFDIFTFLDTYSIFIFFQCVENPTCQEIRDVLDAASFQIGVEVSTLCDLIIYFCTSLLLVTGKQNVR